MKMMKPLFIIGVAITLCSCKSFYSNGSVANAPATSAETSITSDTATVKSDIVPGATDASIQDNLLRRCAQITVQHGYGYFVITSNTTPPAVPGNTAPQAAVATIKMSQDKPAISGTKAYSAFDILSH